MSLRFSGQGAAARYNNPNRDPRLWLIDVCYCEAPLRKRMLKSFSAATPSA